LRPTDHTAGFQGVERRGKKSRNLGKQMGKKREGREGEEKGREEGKGGGKASSGVLWEASLTLALALPQIYQFKTTNSFLANV